jgi:hypothetical protein
MKEPVDITACAALMRPRSSTSGSWERQRCSTACSWLVHASHCCCLANERNSTRRVMHLPRSGARSRLPGMKTCTSARRRGGGWRWQVAGGAVRSMRWAAGQLYPALGRHPCKQTVAVAANQPTVARVEQALVEAPAFQSYSLLCLAFAMLATGCTALRRSA